MTALKNVLFINGISSGLTGIALACFPRIVSNLFGAPTLFPFLITGVFLAVFAALVLMIATRHNIHRLSVWLIIAVDVTWVIGSFILLTLPLKLSNIGIIAVVAVAAWVSIMAILQFIGVKKLTRQS